MTTSLEWAAAISPRHDAIRIGDQNNGYRREAPWPQHEPAHPWAVYLANHGKYRSLALDFDCGPGLNPGDDARDAFRLLQSFGFPPVLVDSGGDGYHVLARLPDRTPAGLLHPIVRSLGNFWPSLDVAPMVNSPTGCIRPPGSLHRSGGTSRVLVGSLLDFSAPPNSDAMDRLQSSIRPLQPTLTPTTTSASFRQSNEITDRIESLLRNGDIEKRYHSRSEMIQAIALGFVRAERTLDALFLALQDPANVGGEKVREKFSRAARKYVELSYRKALAFEPAREQPASVSTEIRAFARAVERADWPGSAGATDRTVVTALIDVASQIGSTTIGMSVRQLGELAGIHKGTAARSLRRLKKAGFIERVAEAHGHNAAVWKLRRRPADSQIHRGGVS